MDQALYSPTHYAVALPVPAPATGASAPNLHPWKAASFSFHDLLDTINPLQHIPVVATIYRALTGDTIGNVARVVGDTLYGGPIGLLTGLAGADAQIATGKDIGDHVLALLGVNAGAPTGAPPPAARPATAAVPAAVPATAGASPAILAQMPGAVTPGTVPPLDPRAAFLQRAKLEIARGAGRGSGQTAEPRPSHHVVPLELTGVGLPPNLRLGSPFMVSRIPATGAPAGAPPTAAAAAASPATVPTPAPATLPAGTMTSAAGAGPAGPTASPASAPVDVSQKMLEALDKYARMARQREQRNAPGRGDRVDLVQ